MGASEWWRGCFPFFQVVQLTISKEANILVAKPFFSLLIVTGKTCPTKLLAGWWLRNISSYFYALIIVSHWLRAIKLVIRYSYCVSSFVKRCMGRGLSLFAPFESLFPSNQWQPVGFPTPKRSSTSAPAPTVNQHHQQQRRRRTPFSLPTKSIESPAIDIRMPRPLPAQLTL